MNRLDYFCIPIILFFLAIIIIGCEDNTPISKSENNLAFSELKLNTAETIEKWNQLLVLSDDARQFSTDISLVPSVKKLDLISGVNLHFNIYYLYEKDDIQYLKSDYWASPKEFQTSKKGDCEDYAISKYYYIKQKGFIDPKDMWIVVVKIDNFNSKDNTTNHAVLLVRIGTEFYILDNRYMNVLSTKDISEYKPIYYLNEYGLFFKSH